MTAPAKRASRIPLIAALITGFVCVIAVYFIGVGMSMDWQRMFLSVVWIPVFAAVAFVYTRLKDAEAQRRKR